MVHMARMSAILISLVKYDLAFFSHFHDMKNLQQYIF